MSVGTRSVAFMGSKRLGLRVLTELRCLALESLIGVLTIDDRDDRRTELVGFQEFSRVTGVPLYLARDRRHSEELVRSLKPELCFVVGWYWLISQATLDIVPRRFIGLHNSLLPKYRGGSPLVWAIINGEQTVGFSIFTLTSGTDDGPVWARGSVPLGEDEYVGDVLAKLEAKAVEVLRDKYAAIVSGSVTPVEQEHRLATYCAQRLPADGSIDWRWQARYIYNFIRAQSEPYPGAFTRHEERIMTVWRARLFDHDYYGAPGQIAKIGPEGVYVICGDNRALILEEVEVSGKRGRAQDFITSIKTRL